MMVLLVYFLDIGFRSVEGVSATLGDGYVIQGQSYVARLQGRILWVWPRYRNFMLSIWCFKWILSDMFKWSNGQQNTLLFQRSVIVSREGKFFNVWYCEPSVMLIASAKSQSVRGASHQPAFMSGCLTISHMCLPCLLSERRLLFSKWLFLVGREVSWERWESSEPRRWKRCMTGVKGQGGKGVWVEWVWGDKLGMVAE